MITSIENGHLVIKLPLTAPTLSKSGKTHSVGGTGGFKKTKLLVEGQLLSVSVNTYVKPAPVPA